MKNLAKKLATITKTIGKVQTDAINTHSNYSYISYEQMNAILRNLLEEHQLAIIPAVKNYEEREYTTNKGALGVRTIVSMEFTLIDYESGETFATSFTGADQDSGGKSMGQAITECVKRFEFKLFHISTKDDVVVDPDSKTTDDIKPEPATQKQWGKLSELVHGKPLKDLSEEERKQVGAYIKECGFSAKGLTKDQAELIIKKG